MAGNTGKMTAAAIMARGPRLQLLVLSVPCRRVGFMIAREGQPAVIDGPHVIRRVYACSYSLGYLLRIGRGVSL